MNKHAHTRTRARQCNDDKPIPYVASPSLNQCNFNTFSVAIAAEPALKNKCPPRLFLLRTSAFQLLCTNDTNFNARAINLVCAASQHGMPLPVLSRYLIPFTLSAWFGLMSLNSTCLHCSQTTGFSGFILVVLSAKTSFYTQANL